MKRCVLVLTLLLAPGSVWADEVLEVETLFRGSMTLPWSTQVETHLARKLPEIGASGLWSQLPEDLRIRIQFYGEGNEGDYLAFNQLAAVSAPDREVEIVRVVRDARRRVIVSYRVAPGAAQAAANNVHLIRVPRNQVRFERLPDAPVSAGAGGLTARLGGAAGERAVAVCHTFGCKSTVGVQIPEAAWKSVRALFTPPSTSAAQERERVAVAVGLLEVAVGPQAGTSGDEGGWDGNFAGGSSGSQDCLDEATNTTTYLGLLVQDGLIRFHRPEENKRRGFFATHYSASMRELATNRVYVVDSWFRDNGHPAVIQTLKAWKKKTEPAGGTRVVNLPLGQ